MYTVIFYGFLGRGLNVGKYDILMEFLGVSKNLGHPQFIRNESYSRKPMDDDIKENDDAYFEVANCSDNINYSSKDVVLRTQKHSCGIQLHSGILRISKFKNGFN